MARPGVGNPGNKGGKPGVSGRKSAYQERQDAEWHEFVWKQEQDVAALEEKIRSKKYAGRDAIALQLLRGDKTIAAKFIDKLVPNLPENHQLTGELTIRWKKDDGNNNSLLSS